MVQTGSAKKTGVARSSKVSPVHGDDDDASLSHLRKAFNMIDTTNRGYIDAEDLCVLLKLQGIHVSKDEIKYMIQMYHSPGASGNVLSFDEFCAVMDNSEDASLAEITESVAIKARTRLGQMAQRGEPLWIKQHQKTLRSTLDDGTISLQTKKGMSARLELGKIVDGVYVHGIILTLIILDVICVICELTLAATICLDPNASSSSGAGAGHRRRFLLSAATSPSPASESVQHSAFCTDCMQIQLDVEHVLHVMSVTILFIFLFQICLLVVAYGSNFSKSIFYVGRCGCNCCLSFRDRISCARRRTFCGPAELARREDHPWILHYR